MEQAIYAGYREKKDEEREDGSSIIALSAKGRYIGYLEPDKTAKGAKGPLLIYSFDSTVGSESASTLDYRRDREKRIQKEN
jgi:hypothetical protein